MHDGVSGACEERIIVAARCGLISAFAGGISIPSYCAETAYVSVPIPQLMLRRRSVLRTEHHRDLLGVDEMSKISEAMRSEAVIGADLDPRAQYEPGKPDTGKLAACQH